MNKRGFTLVSTMVTLVIIAMLSVVFMYGSGAFQKGGPKSSRPDGLGTTIPGAAEDAAKDTVCRSNLQQVRMSLEIAQGGTEEHASSLSDLHLPAEVLKCAVGHEAYIYDPNTGTVHCPHLGHEKY
jgi:pilin/secretion family protein with methylation motif